MVLLFCGMSGSPEEHYFSGSDAGSFDPEKHVDLERESEGLPESEGGVLTESSGSSERSPPKPRTGDTHEDRISVSHESAVREPVIPPVIYPARFSDAVLRNREMARRARAARLYSKEDEAVEAALRAEVHARTRKRSVEISASSPLGPLSHRTRHSVRRHGRSAAAAAAESRAADARSRGAPSHRRRAAHVEERAIEASDALRLELERVGTSEYEVADHAESREIAEAHALRLERRRVGIAAYEVSDSPEGEGPEVPEEDLPEEEGTNNVQDFFTYCKQWLDHERRNSTMHVKILPEGRKASRMCLSSRDDAPKREKKLADMIGIGVLFVQHCGVLIPDEKDDNTDITDNLRADLRKYTTNKSLEELFATYRADKPAKLTLPQCVWMLNQFPKSAGQVTECMSRSDTDLMLGYRRMITHAQCERLKLDLVEYSPACVYTTDVIQDGEYPFQENILAILHRSADAHNRAGLDSVKFTVADAVWLSLHTNDDDNAKDDPAFEHIMHTVMVHCKHEFEVQRNEKKKQHYQRQINDCKTPGQLLRGSTSTLEMSPSIYPYHLRPLFPQYETVQVDIPLRHAKEMSDRHELTRPRPRPYEAVLELLYEANCNLNQTGPFLETTGFVDVLFPTRRPWKLPTPRGLAIRRAHAKAMKHRFPDTWYDYRDKVPLRVWMQIPVCVSSVFYFKHVHLLSRDTIVSFGNSPAPVSDEPDFGFPGLPVALDGKHGGFANPSNACYMNASFQALLRSNIGPRFMQSVQRMSRSHLSNLRTYWHTQSTAVKREMKEATRRLLKGKLQFRHGAMPRLCTYEMLILYVIDAHSKNVREGVETGSVQDMISKDAVPLNGHERTALEKKCTAMIGPNYLREVPDDYNCFFHCMAVSQHPDYSTEERNVRQAELRQELVAYMRPRFEGGTLSNILQAMVTEEWLRTMANDLEMGDDIAMMGMSSMLGRRIIVYRPMHGGHLTVFQEYDPEVIRDENAIHIFHNGIHFDVLVPPIIQNAKMDMTPENPNQVALYTKINTEVIKQKMLDEKVRGVWNHFIFFAAMYELAAIYCDAQTQKTVSLLHLYDLLLVHRLKINADLGRHLFDYRRSNDAGEAVFELCDRSETFASSIKDTHETLKILISNQEINNGVCSICSTPAPVRNISNPIARILLDMPTVLDNTPRNLQDFTREAEGQTEGTYECDVCEGAGTAVTMEKMTDGRLARYYGGTRTFSRRHADFTCFQLNWISNLQENGEEQPAHNPNLLNFTIPETLQLVGVDSAEHAYNLIAAVHHVGGAHYTACVKVDGVWMNYNDVTAVTCTLADAVRCTGAQSDPYLLFYEKAGRARGAETPSASPRAATPSTPPRDEPGAVYVGLPWDDTARWAALQATVPSWPDGSSTEEETDAMWPWIASNPNIEVAMQTIVYTNVYCLPLLKRLATLIGRSPNMIFGTKRIERLTKHRESTVTSGVVLSQSEILTLMSCAVFNLFPHSIAKEHEHIGLTRIFRFASTRQETWGFEKTQCILNYLLMAEADRGGTREVRFKRHVARFSEDHWAASTMPMYRCNWHDVDAASGAVVKIEDVCDNLRGQAWEVDFANRDIGGGVTGGGCVQEEIRFMQCPELLVSILFTDRLDDNESIQITGYRQFNDTRGYGRENNPLRFEYVGAHLRAEPSHGRSMLVMDATHYSADDWTKQFRWRHIKRELNKARCAFDYTENTSWPIVTGHWGCGAFHGNHRLKLYIQLLAAAEAGKAVEYCNFGDRRGAETRTFMQSIPVGVPVGKLYRRLKQVVMEHDEDLRWYRDTAHMQTFFDRLTRTRYHSRVTPVVNVFFDDWN